MKKLLVILVFLTLVVGVEYLWLRGHTVVDIDAGKYNFRIRAVPTTFVPGLSDGHFYIAEVLLPDGSPVSSCCYRWDSYRSKTFKTTVDVDRPGTNVDVFLDDGNAIHVQLLRGNQCSWWSSRGGDEQAPYQQQDRAPES